jgi:DHA1 family tetracycline resistance protein-like MFS transporter
MRTRTSANRKANLGSIFLTVFLDLVGFGLVLPFLAEEARDSFGVTPFTATLLSAVYSLMQFLFVPVWGRLSDRVGRRPVLVWSVAATAVGMAWLGAALAFGSSIGWLFAARAFSGIATANLGTASAYIADITKPEDRARGMGLIGMAFGLGFILGPGIGGALAKVAIGGRHGPLACFVAAGLSVVNFGWVWFGLAESLSEETRAEKRAQPRRLTPLNLDAAKAAFAIPGIALAVLVNFLIILSFTNLDQTFRFFNKDRFGMNELETGMLLAFIGIVAAGVQGGLIRPLAKRFDEATLIRIGVAVQAIAFSGIALSPSFGRPMLYASGACLALGNGLTQPTVSAFVSKRAPGSAQGGTLGTNQAAASLARVFGPAFGGWIYGALGPRSPYVAAAIGMVVAFAFAWALQPARRVQSTPPEQRPPQNNGPLRTTERRAPRRRRARAPTPRPRSRARRRSR